MSLRALMTTAVVVLTILVLITAGALVALSTALNRTATELAAAMESVRLVEELEVEVLRYHRLANRALVDNSGPPFDKATLRASIALHLSAMKQYVSGQEEELLIEVVRTRTDEFLVLRDRAQLEGWPLERVVVEAGELLDHAFTSMEDLVQLNVRQAREASARADAWNRIADIVGWSTALLLLLGGGALIAWLRSAAFAPVIAISAAIRNFGGGERSLRLAETGPRELRDIARRFNEMSQAVEEQERKRLAFVGGVAHDLRNPLAALRMAVDVLHRGDGALDEARLRQVVGVAYRQVDLLDRMVRDLLEASRIHAGELDLQVEVIDPAVVAESVVDLYATAHPERTIRLGLPSRPAHVRADPVRLEQVLGNLVRNAVKYSPEGGPIDVRVTNADEQVVVTVADRGVGVTPGEEETIFKPFHRSETVRRAVAGAGLGLAVARRIIEAHGGHISASARPGGGSIFTLLLPQVAEADVPDEPPAKKSTPPD